MSYTYDALGRRTQMQAPGVAPVTYGYDAASRLTSITQAPLAPVTMEYDAAGRRTRLTLPNQVSTEYQYDTATRLTALIYRNAAGPLGDLTYGYDAAGNRTSVGGSFARTLLPDPLAAATYDDANRQLTFGDRTLTYDANGNTTGDGVNAYTWDARNRLAALTGPVPGSFVYDAFGRRTAKTIGGALTTSLHDGLNPVQLADQAGVTDLLTGLAVDEYLAVTTGGSALGFLSDALGSTVALTDAAGAAPTEYTYDAFGAVTATGSSPNRFVFTGREDDGTGVYYYRARHYHPTLQRFISEDPIGLSGGINVYAYALNNPLRFIDPMGLDVTITLWACCAGFDHIGIGVGPGRQPTVGFYPVTAGRPFDEGIVVLDTERQPFFDFRDWIVIKTTPEQDRLIQAYIDARTRRPAATILQAAIAAISSKMHWPPAGLNP